WASRLRARERGAVGVGRDRIEALRNLVDSRADAGCDRCERVDVEPVDGGGVAGEELLQLDGVGSGERPPKALRGVRVRALVVGVVAAPHELVDADLVAALRLARAREAGRHPAVAGEVLAGLEREALVVGVLDLADAS